jgi:hypothetical protein
MFATVACEAARWLPCLRGVQRSSLRSTGVNREAFPTHRVGSQHAALASNPSARRAGGSGGCTRGIVFARFLANPFAARV